MGENDDEKHCQAAQIFENFVQASTCKGTIQAFSILTRQLELDPLDNRNVYTKLKSKVTSWKAKALWNKLDKKANHKEYKRGKACVNTKVIVILGSIMELSIMRRKIGWRAEFLPVDHPLSEFEFDVVIGADGRRNTLEGFRRKEFRGKLAIAITANFINRNTTAEAKVEEISGVAFIFNQKFFQDLKEETGIDLENIVYYKDSTHYFVMTAKKQSLLDKGVIINDYIDTEMLLCGENVNQDNLLSYAREAADFATNYQLPSLDFAINHYGQSDVAMFDFTSMYASENAALVRERHRHQLLVALVGDSLLEPFWPMGTSCARGFLAAFDTAWMVKSWDQGKPPLEILAERESIYRLLPQTTPENITKHFDQYTIDPATRYPNLNSSCVRPHQVRHLYVTNELQQCSLERVSSIRRSVNLSRHESDIRPNKLLTWCQKQTEGYMNVNVIDLTNSWRNGLALCAIMHHFRPDLIDFDSLNEDDVIQNNQLAFDIAEREFGIPPVTTGKEMASAGEPDKLGMVMYLSKLYELFRGTPLRAVDAIDKQNGENNDLCYAKSSKFIFNNFINLTLPRKRIPKVRKAEENEMNKRRRKSLSNFEEVSINRGKNLGNLQGDMKEGINQNKVKSMATQLLAKFEENAPSTTLRRQGSLRREFPHSIGGSDICCFCKKRVYIMERLSAEGHFFHRECFKCDICSMTLRLAVYAFDAEEGKFYCKAHFAHCRTGNKHRKRRATQKTQEQCREVCFNFLCFLSDYYLHIVEEHTSPKKPKNVPGCYNIGSRRSPVSPEWASVRIVPEEDMTEHNLLAICVMVTSDGSRYYEMQRENKSGAYFSQEGANHRNKEPGFSLAVLIKAVKTRRKLIGKLHFNKIIVSLCLADFPLSYSKKSGLSSKESSAGFQNVFEEDLSHSQLMSHNKPTGIKTGHFKSWSPVLQRKGKNIDSPEEIPSYIPHHPFEDSTKEYPLAHSKSYPGETLTSTPSYKMHRDEEEGERDLENWNANDKEHTPETRACSRRNTVLTSLDSEEKGKSHPRSQKEQTDQQLNDAKSKIMRKLTLSIEQKAELLNMNGADLDQTKKEHQSKGISELKDADCNRRKNTLKQSHLSISSPFANSALPTLSVDQKIIPNNSDNTPREHVAGQPKSSLRLIANVIKRSILDPLISNPEGIKKNMDVKAKPTSEHTFSNFPNTYGHTVNLRKGKSCKEHDVQPQGSNVLDSTRKDLDTGICTANLESSFSSSLKEKSSCDNSETSFPVYSLHTSPSKNASKPETSSYTKMDDVPKLLEKFTLKEKPRKFLMDDLCIRNQKNILYSSLRLRKKTSEARLGDPEQRNDIWTLFSNLRNKGDDRDKNDSLNSSTSISNNLTTEKNPFAVQRQLEEVEERQRDLEIYGVQLERELRGESDSGTQDETQLLQEWFNLVLEKNKLMRYESELLIAAQELELEDHQSRLEQKLRDKMAVDGKQTGRLNKFN
uniref:Microtubule associated monooxygenase, calponin and LIM domain containing 2 n=1 Tax=Sphenodon punctatus TaxID=8508 RepID=A0A8D0GBT2_SPHPU